MLLDHVGRQHYVVGGLAHSSPDSGSALPEFSVIPRPVNSPQCLELLAPFTWRLLDQCSTSHGKRLKGHAVRVNVVAAQLRTTYSAACRQLPVGHVLRDLDPEFLRELRLFN